MNGFFSERITVDDLAALVAIENPANKTIRGLRDNSAASNGTGDFNWYHFVLGSEASTALPDVARDTTDTGAWLAQPVGGGGGGNVEVIRSEEDNPSAPPQFDGSDGISFYILLVDGTTPSQTLYFGADKTGALGENGWIALQSF